MIPYFSQYTSYEYFRCNSQVVYHFANDYGAELRVVRGSEFIKITPLKKNYRGYFTPFYTDFNMGAVHLLKPDMVLDKLLIITGGSNPIPDNDGGVTIPPLSGVLVDDIIDLALSRLGHPYSQSLRGQDTYVDCSYFTRWCYQNAGGGSASFTAGTAASQAQYCVDNSFDISYASLSKGDLVFWSYGVNGRYLDIGHVGIFDGAGKVIDASSSQGQVVHRNIFDFDKQIMYGRPR